MQEKTRLEKQLSQVDYVDESRIRIESDITNKEKTINEFKRVIQTCEDWISKSEEQLQNLYQEKDKGKIFSTFTMHL